jgi:hypothetical protein
MMTNEAVSADFISRMRGPSDYVPFDAPTYRPLGRKADSLTAVFDRAIDGLRMSGEWGKSPAYVPPAELVPPPLYGPAARPVATSLHDQARAVRVVRAARERVRQNNAIDAPFTAMDKAKWRAGKGGTGGVRASVASARSPGVALGFTTTETSDTKGNAEGKKRPLRDRLHVDPQAKRLKRMRSTVNHAARLLHFDAHTERHAQLWNKKFLTLTYADLGDWEPGHFTAFRKAMREWCHRRGVRLRFVWVAELQKRGALHYHVIVWLPKGKYLPFADAQGWWPHGRTNIVNAQSPIGYITKYASKATSADALGFPKGARICGHGGLTGEGRRHVRYWNSPIWVREALTGKADIRKVVGGYMDKFTGEFLPSPWRVEIGADGQVWAYRIDQQPLEQAA